ncbi:MAG: Holliday junction resolvase RuvX [Flavobacteriales bacterium]|nr:Holliday junction resolvase RuvX [Flavobacteriales bacterium]
MSKVIAIDYGNKRVGLAVTDELQLIATRLTTVHSKEVIPFLTEFVITNNVETFVIGKPLNLKGEDTDSSESVRNFTIHLKKKFPKINVVEVDERFTSKMASQVIAKSGMSKKKRQNKGLIDQVSAVIMLQDYLKNKEYKMDRS